MKASKEEEGKPAVEKKAGGERRPGEGSWSPPANRAPAVKDRNTQAGFFTVRSSKDFAVHLIGR
jgi:hypothetical protein